MRRRLLVMLVTASMSTSTVAAMAQAPAHPFLDPLFTDNMVLQRDRSDAMWGWSTPGDYISVTVGSKVATAVADSGGKWVVQLPAMHAGGPYTIKVNGPRTATLNNVLFGDVWICSGQSNMQFGIGNLVDGGKDEIAAADHPNIRLFMVPNVTAATPQDLVQGTWSVCSPESITFGGWSGFTAVGYFFGRDLERDTHVPIGLIETTWGGTPGESWVSADALKKLTDFANVDDVVSQAVASNTRSVDDQMKAGEAYVAAHDALSQQSPNPSDPAFDDSSWKSMSLPVNWQDVDGLQGYHGVCWFRRSFDLTAAQTGKDLALSLGPIDDRDTTWVNGVRVGGGVEWDLPRDYTIPASALRAGKNVIAIRVLDTGGASGVDGKPEQMHVDLSDGTSIALTGAWQYDASTNLNDMGTVPNIGPVALQNTASMLYNAMIAPLIPYGVKGAIWYQGESNVGRDVQYQKLLPTLIDDWRTRWDEPNFPFYIVQLANYTAVMPDPTDEGWARLREAQSITARTVPNTGLAVTIDIGNAGDIHPKDKQDVGRRLELIALDTLYHQKVEYSGPAYASMKVDGSSIRLNFTHAAGLMAKGDKLTGFAIAGADKKFYWADARIDGDTIVVSSTQVSSPVAVRYAWAANPICNLYNSAGLPTIPFRTDDWSQY